MPQVADDLIALPQKRAAEIAEVSLGRLRYWELTNVVQPGIRKTIGVRGNIRLYDLEDTVALLAVHELRRRGFSLHRVRKVVQHLRTRGYQQPFAELHFATVGKDEIYFMHPDGTWEGDASPDQLVFHQVLNLERLRERIRARIGRQPADHGKVEQRPKTMGRKPLFAGTRIPVDTVIRWLDHGRTTEQIIEAYPDLVPEDIETARRTRPASA